MFITILQALTNEHKLFSVDIQSRSVRVLPYVYKAQNDRYETPERISKIPTRLVIRNLTTNILSTDNLSEFNFDWESEKTGEEPYTSTLLYPMEYIGRELTSKLLTILKARHLDYPITSKINEKIQVFGLPPESFLYALMKKIDSEQMNHKSRSDDIIFCLPKYYAIPQIEPIAHESLFNRSRVYVYDSSFCAASHFTHQFQSYFFKRTRICLLIDFGETSVQLCVLEVQKRGPKKTREVFYDWTEDIGGRDFSVSIADLIKEKLGINMTDNEYHQLIWFAECLRNRVNGTSLINESFSGINFTMTPREIEKSCEMHLSAFTNFLLTLLRTYPASQFDKVFLYGSAARCFSIKELVNSMFSKSKIVAIGDPLNVVVKGGSEIRFMTDGYQTIVPYTLYVKTKTSMDLLDASIPLPEGNITIEYGETKMPYGIIRKIVSAVTNRSTVIIREKSTLIRLRWVEHLNDYGVSEFVKIGKRIAHQYSNEKKRQEKQKELEKLYSSIQYELEEPSIEEVLDLDEKLLVENFLVDIKQALVNKDVSNVKELEMLIFQAMDQPRGRYYNMKNMNRKVSDLFELKDEIEHEIALNRGAIEENDQTQEGFEMLFNYTNWIQQKIHRQATLAPHQDPVLLLDHLIGCMNKMRQALRMIVGED